MLVEGRRFFEPIQRNNPLLSPKFQNKSKENSIVRRYDTRYRARYGHGQTKLITKKKKKKKKGKRGTKLKLIRLPLIFAGGGGGNTLPTYERHYDNISLAHDFFLITPSRRGG